MDERLRAGPHVFVEDLEEPALEEGDEHHLVKVLRLRHGRPLTVSDGFGGWRPATWTGSSVEPSGEVVREPAPQWEVTVAAPPVKGDRTDWMVAKLTELGVDRIVLVESRRSVVRWQPDRAERHLSRLRRIARESSMQSRRVRLPELVGPSSVSDLVGLVGGAHLRVAELGAPSWELPGEVATGDDAWAHVARGVVVGPEGGWEPGEVDDLGAPVGLPGGVLRTETAALVAGTLLVTNRGHAEQFRHGW